MIILKMNFVNCFNEISSGNFSYDIEEIKNILKININKYETELNFEYIECSYCKSDNLISYGTYTRNIGVFDEYYKIYIKRVKCKNCNHTHALIPSFILPFFQNESSFVLTAIELIINNNCLITYISNLLNITRQNIYFWRKRFNNHITRLKSTISPNISDIFNELFKGIEVRIKYEFINGIRFLQKVPT